MSRRVVKNKLLNWSRMRSLWLLHLYAGSGCNGCDIELLAALTPRYDVERFGMKLVGSPRHADVLAVTGGVTKAMAERLRRIYEQMPEPKFVIAIGTCATSAGIFSGGYNVVGSVDKVIPVDVYVPGCPPRPEAIIQGFAILMEKIRKGEYGE